MSNRGETARLVAAAEAGLARPQVTKIALQVGCSEATVRDYFVDASRVSAEMRARIDAVIGFNRMQGGRR